MLLDLRVDANSRSRSPLSVSSSFAPEPAILAAIAATKLGHIQRVGA
jgi:hypothetical protein